MGRPPLSLTYTHTLINERLFLCLLLLHVVCMCLCVCVSNSNWLIVLAAYQFVGWTLLIEQPLQSDTGKCLSVSLSVCVLCDNTLSTHSMQLHGYYYYSLLEVLQISSLWPKAPNFNVFRIIL